MQRVTPLQRGDHDVAHDVGRLARDRAGRLLPGPHRPALPRSGAPGDHRRRHGRGAAHRRGQEPHPLRDGGRRRSSGREDRSLRVRAVGGAPRRRLGPRRPPGRAGARRRRLRGALSVGRDADLQPRRRRLQEGLLRRLQPLDRRVPGHVAEPSRRRRSDRPAQRGRGRGGPAPHPRSRPAGRDDARHPRLRRRGRRLRRSGLGSRSGRRRSALRLPLSFHILTAGSTVGSGVPGARR